MIETKAFRISRIRFFVLVQVIGILCFPFVADSHLVPFAFRHTRALGFSTAAPTLYPNLCTAMVVQAKIGGKTAVTPSAMTVTLTPTGPIGFYSDMACTNSITSTTIAAGASSSTVYVMASATGAASLDLTSPGFMAFSLSTPVSVNPFVWTGGGGSNTWATGANWSGGTAPNASQIAFFDNSCSTYCDPKITAAVGGIRILSTFTGTLYQNTGATTAIGSYGFQQAGGTFEGSLGGDTMTMGGNFILSGGTFKAPSGNLDLSGITWYVTGSPTFTHNSGTVRVPGNFMNLAITPGSIAFYNFENLGRQNGVTVTGTLTILNNLKIQSLDASNSQQWYGNVNVGGNLTILGQGALGSTNFNLNGSADQTIDTSGTTTGYLPSLSISSTGGTVYLVGTIYVTVDYKKNSGTINAGTSTLYLSNTWPSRNHIFGGGSTETYNNLVFTASNGSHTLTGSAIVSGKLTLYSSNSSFGTLSGGTLSVTGDLEGLGYGMRGSTLIKMEGSTNKAIDYSAANATARAPQIEVAKTGGATLTLLGIINYTDSWTWVSGTIVPGTSTLAQTYMVFGAKSVSPGATQTYNVFNLGGPGGSTTNILTTLNAATITFANNNADYHLPNPGTGISVNATGTMTVNTGARLYLHGGTKTHGTLVNNGTIIP